MSSANPTIAPALGWCVTCNANVRLYRVTSGYWVCASEWSEWERKHEALPDIEPGSAKPSAAEVPRE